MLTADIPLSSGGCVSLRLVNDAFLESFSLPLSGGEVVVVLERDVTRPVEDVVRQCRRDVSALREVVRQWPLQALLIEKMYLPVPVLRIERNYHAFCPLYALYGKGTLHLEWDPVNLYRYLEGPGLLNRGQCVAFLEGRWNYGPETVFRDIHMLPERGVLEVTEAGGLNIVRPPSLAVPSPRALAEGSDPVERLHDLLKAAVARWPLAAGTAFCELSSGHDTTLVAHILAGRFSPEALKTVGYHLSSGTNAAAVMARRGETIARLKTVDFTLPDAVSVPGLASPSGKTWPYHTYGNSIHPLAGHIVSAGGKIVFSHWPRRKCQISGKIKPAIAGFRFSNSG